MKRRLVVAGGGLAGISAALEAADSGAAVTLLETRRSLGGLTRSFTHEGMLLDNGQHVFLRCCEAYLRFLDRIGASGDVTLQRRLDLPVLVGAKTFRLRRRNLPVPLHLAGSLLRYPGLTLAERARLGAAAAALARLELADPALDRQSFGQWLAAHGQTPNAIARLWDLIVVPTVNLPSAEASAAMGAKVFKTGLLSSPGAGDVGWSRVPLGVLHGQRAAQALASSGVRVLTSAAVHQVDICPEGGFEVRSSAGNLSADAVVVALPPKQAAEVLPAGAGLGGAKELGSSAVCDVHLFFDRVVCPHELAAVAGAQTLWVFDRSVAAGLEGSGSPARQYLAVSISAADRLLELKPAQIAEQTLQALTASLPLAGEARLVDFVVTKERHATFRATPGSAQLRPGARTPLAGLALAGAWTSTGWPATMEGAVRSGVSAARVALEGSTRPGALTIQDTKEVA